MPRKNSLSKKADAIIDSTSLQNKVYTIRGAIFAPRCRSKG